MRALLLAALLVLAGCTAVPPAGTDSPTPIPTPTGPCAVDARPTPDGAGSEVQPVDYPDPPESLTTEAVHSYVGAFEESYIHNDALAGGGNVTYLETYVEDVTVTKHGDAFVVRLNSYTNGGYRDTEGETPIEVHWDGAPEPVTYLVTDDRVLRGEGDISADRLRHQPTVACF